MKQMSRSGICLSLAIAGLLQSSTAWAAKPAPPPPQPAPPGLIYYTTDNGELWAMKADGTNQTKILSSVPGSPIPCFYPQGGSAFHDRWFVCLMPTPGKIYDIRIHPTTGAILAPEPHYDIYAYRGQPGNPALFEFVQLTDLFGYFRFTQGQVNWSNDTNDDQSTSFIGAGGRDIRDAFYYDENGNSVLDFRDAVLSDLRLPITATEIQAGWLGGDFVPFEPNDRSDLDSLVSVENPGLWGATTKMLSQDGNMAVGVGSNQVFLYDLFNPMTSIVIWDGGEGPPTQPRSLTYFEIPAWSPDGTQIVVVDPTRAAGGGIWRLSIDGSAPLQIGRNSTAKKGDLTEWNNNHWSPDSQYLLCNRIGYRKTKFFRDIVVLPANGGTPVKELPNFSGSPIRWVSGTP